MNHTYLCLSSRSWYSFTDRGGMEGWVGLGCRVRQIEIEQGLTSHQIYRGWSFTGQMLKWPNQQCQSTEGRQVLRMRLQSHQVHLTMLTIYNNYAVLIKNTKYTQINRNKSMHSEIGPLYITKPNPENCENCLFKHIWSCRDLDLWSFDFKI